MTNSLDLHQTARWIFAEALRSVDAGLALRRAVSMDGARLRIIDTEFDLQQYSNVYSIALGKAARPMAQVLTEILGARLTGGVVSAPSSSESLSACWRVFAGGHPLPNEASLAAGRAAIELLREADQSSALVLFLISGGGSAMLESLRDSRITLEDLRAANRNFVNCGATIAEINALRCCLSSVKGGGLSLLLRRATPVSLIISDTNSGDEAAVASGPTIAPPRNSKLTSDARKHITDIIARYNLRQSLPTSVTRAIDEDASSINAGEARNEASSFVYVLLDNARAIDAAAEAARSRGFAVEIASDLFEEPIAEGCRELVSRLFELRRRAGRKRNVCLLSGGEFACAVRGNGTGGRNSEAALRCAIEMDKLTFETKAESFTKAGQSMIALHAGTDGIDGNSPAAGAIADDTTLRRARARGLDAYDFLARSDAYTFFQHLDETIITGPTATNVRDLRILLACADQA
jgi:hydroxypyruvate reductase